MNLKNRIKQIEEKTGLDKTGEQCRCQNPHIKIRSKEMREQDGIDNGGGHRCENCGKTVSLKYYESAEIVVIKPEVENEH